MPLETINKEERYRKSMKPLKKRLKERKRKQRLPPKRRQKRRQLQLQSLRDNSKKREKNYRKRRE